MRYFKGYRRKKGRPGVRNYIAVIATVTCANVVAQNIAARSSAGIAVTHDTGCLEFGEDRALTERTIKGMALQPNAGAAIFVGLGCEQIDTEKLASEITDKPCAAVIIQKAGGSSAAVREGAKIVKTFEKIIDKQERETFSTEELIVAVKCGGSDFTNAVASNPGLGCAMDTLVEKGGTAILTETSGFPGSEHVLAEQAINGEVAKKIWEIVDQYRGEVKEKFNLNINDGNPSPGNIAGGITTLVEKSLGNIRKGGSTPIQGVLEFAEQIGSRKGLWIMDTPGHDIFSLAGAAAGGAQILAFTTGRGSPLGCALVPVIKICACKNTVNQMGENIDLDLSGVMEGKQDLLQAGEEVFNKIVETASGELTATEKLEHFEFAIPRLCRTL